MAFSTLRGLLATVALSVTVAWASTPTEALTPLGEAVTARYDGLDPATPRASRERRALSGIASRLSTPPDTLSAEMGIAIRVGRMLRRSFRNDVEFAPLFDSALQELTAAADAERSRLAAWTGRLDDPSSEATLAGEMARVSHVFDRAADANGNLRRMRVLRRACRRIDDARIALNLPDEPPASGPQMPDFRLSDLNPNSPSQGRDVSPRDYLGKISAWYFGHAT
jgi:hypothetical protein